MHKTWTETLALLAMALLLDGCTTSKEELLPHDNRSMLDIWNVETGSGSARQLLDARQALRRPLSEADVHAAPTVQARYTRTAANEIYRQFHRLSNPDLLMYVFPHLAGSDPVPVPGYTTLFPLYQRVQYALPGERVEDY
ncbi:TPA: TIGR03751 family conjugal transfer lipoprotein [Pseudomonas aeruginosa]